jgi:hypothetical protein
MRCRLQQFLGVAYAHPVDPSHRGLPGFGLESPVERPDARRRLGGNVFQTQVTMGLFLDPGQQVGQFGARRAPVPHDELGLAPLRCSGATANRAASAATVAP